LNRIWVFLTIDFDYIEYSLHYDFDYIEYITIMILVSCYFWVRVLNAHLDKTITDDVFKSCKNHGITASLYTVLLFAFVGSVRILWSIFYIHLNLFHLTSCYLIMILYSLEPDMNMILHFFLHPVI